MGMVSNCLSLAWGLWFHFWLLILTFIGGMMAILASFFPSPASTIQLVGRTWAQSLLFLGRIRVQVEGLEHLRPGQTYVFAANHRSNCDIFVLYAVLPGQFLWVAKKSLFQIPVFGQAIARMGCVPVDRGNPYQSLRSLNQAAAKVKGGTSMIIFPEGTRVLTKELAPFKKGVFVMALKAAQPIVPVSISGTLAIQPRGAIRVHPGPVKVVIASPLHPEDFKRTADLMATVRQAIAANYDLDFPHGPERPA